MTLQGRLEQLDISLSIVMPGIAAFLGLLAARPRDAFQMPDSVFVVERGPATLRRPPLVHRAFAPLVR